MTVTTVFAGIQYITISHFLSDLAAIFLSESGKMAQEGKDDAKSGKQKTGTRVTDARIKTE